MKSFPRKGIPVVAYESLSKQVAPPCNLFIRYAPNEKELTFRLQFEFEGNQSYALLYHADNLRRQTALLKPSMRLPDNATTRLARNKSHSPDLKHLFLSLKQTCTIQCKPDQVVLAPKSENEQSYRAFVDLAKATAVHILFDYKWMADCVSLSLVLDGLAELHGFPVNENHVRIVEWTTLAFEDLVPCHANGDQPPAYCAVPPYKDVATPNTQPATAVKAPSKQKPPKGGTRRKKPPSSTLSPDENPTLPAASDSFENTKSDDLDPRNETPSTPQATLLEILADDNANAKTFTNLLAYVEKLGKDMLDHADHLRSEADDEFKNAISNYRMVLEDEKEQTIDSAKTALDDVYDSFCDKKAQAVLDGEDDIEQFQAGLLDGLESCMDKNEAKVQEYAEKVLKEGCKKVLKRLGLANFRSEEEREELKLLDQREKMLEDEYRERREILKKERQEIEAYWRAKRELHDTRVHVLKREHDKISS